MPPIYTIGHSTHPAETFVERLRQHGISALGDVRSNPYSRFNPQFNRETLQRSLVENGIAYVFLGSELGARSKDPDCWMDGRVQFDKLARTPLFQSGIGRVIEGTARFRLALMCAEKDPLDCHRFFLVARTLAERGFEIRHILEDGSLEPHERAIDRLLKQVKLDEPDLFRTREESIENAWRTQAQRVAYSREPEVVEDLDLKTETPLLPQDSKAPRS